MLLTFKALVNGGKCHGRQNDSLPSKIFLGFTAYVTKQLSNHLNREVVNIEFSLLFTLIINHLGMKKRVVDQLRRSYFIPVNKIWPRFLMAVNFLTSFCIYLAHHKYDFP